jgi:EAL domain-containing protein (putative c-di-GMP-specific phosphodiesterase class I)
MLKNIINLQKTHLDKNIFLFLSINLSPEEIENITFYKQILNILEKLNYFDFSLKSLLEIEITERTFFYNFKEINERLKFLRQKHIKISIDDFGVNYSSLSLLPKLPIDIIKIDKIFIDNLEEKNYRVLVKSMIDLCQKLNYDVIAEGVETEKQKEILLELGCDKIQGYYYSPPIPVEKYIELIQ